MLYGKGGLLGAHWTFGNPAYLLSSLKLIRQSASYWGIYGVDFFMVFIGAAIFMLVRMWRKKQRLIFIIEILLAIIVVILLNLTTLSKDSENKISISEIQTENPLELSASPEKFLSDFSQKNKLLKEASQKSDIVIFPESSDFSKNLSRFLDPASIPKYFANLAPKNILVIDSNRVPEQEELKSKVVLIDSKDGVVGSYDKRLLTPGGEYYPYISKLALWFFGHFFKNDFVSFNAVFKQGSDGNVLDYKDNKIKVLVCSDIVSPSISKGGDFTFMVNLRNLGIFDGNDLMEKQLFSMARFRSAENGKYLVISSNFGHSYILNQSGDIIKSTSSNGYQLLTADIVPNKKQTWYNKLGDWPILLLSLAVFILGLIKFRYAPQ
ncbi:MAG: nitrilase-related carbon-nitrogen hydrolase, partial [Candidatus Daviesbacteria bacterium]|nr:nitrilase-related carbon-nitrogen hydrolase [Candidatus Daviesbacteria bacterium]